jgi:hypothetical protein
VAVRRLVVAVLAPPAWHPPSIDADRWRLALAEDLLDVLAAMVSAEAAIAATDAAALDVGWPGLRRYSLPSLDLVSLYAAATADGFDQAVLLAGDAPDLPGMLIAKLLRPLTTRPLAAAPAHVMAASGRGDEIPVDGGKAADSGAQPGSAGLLGMAARLPAPAWLPAVGLDDVTPRSLRRLAPRPTDVAPAPGWHRLRGPGDLAGLDPGLEGWDATRSLLAG